MSEAANNPGPVRSAPVLTVDGPSGAGKGTVSRTLAQRLGWRLLDSGALYRVLGLAALNAGLDLDADVERIAVLAKGLAIEFAERGNETRIILDGADVTADIRTEAAGNAASKVAAAPAVRAALLARQRAFAALPGLVADGRDMGTVVFPDAALKVFLIASAEERARRRYKQLREKGIDVSLPSLSVEIAQRDRRDAERAVAPLRPADDAHIIDSTHMSPTEVVDLVLVWLERAGVVVGT